ncbi:unnamed protein product [Bursaphelenchus xylophilus]|uniref:(pine wood nematode) hypothetical protein n=1 Tax=Bursaphelenchus xylophilus TaxID=6326 RepID=A0A1I7SLD2_BURXY|nr:unnamed protein product [Bursaphelenchus xylophilus]CAG9129503.1 unnamed protein product [Bursaphelenchus xylophilus]
MDALRHNKLDISPPPSIHLFSSHFSAPINLLSGRWHYGEIFEFGSSEPFEKPRVDNVEPVEDLGDLFATFSRLAPTSILEEFIRDVPDHQCPEAFNFGGLPLEIMFEIFGHLDNVTAQTLAELIGLKMDPKKAAVHVFKHEHRYREVYDEALGQYPHMKWLTVLVEVEPAYVLQEDALKKRYVRGMKYFHIRRWTSFGGRKFFVVTYEVTKN